MPLSHSKTHNYDFQIAHDQRIRVQVYVRGRETYRFAVSLEVLCRPGDWRRAVCIDNWGGKTHRDRYHPNGQDVAHHEPCFDSPDINAAAKWAQEDLERNAEAYVTYFRGLPGSDCA